MILLLICNCFWKSRYSKSKVISKIQSYNNTIINKIFIAIGDNAHKIQMLQWLTIQMIYYYYNDNGCEFLWSYIILDDFYIQAKSILK